MKIMQYSGILMALILLLTIGCSDEPIPFSECDVDPEKETNDGEIDDTERSIMDDCLKNAFTDKEEIEKHLVGEWILVGHGEGWVFSVPQPCSQLNFTASTVEVQYNDGFIDTSLVTTWEVKSNVKAEPFNHNVQIAGNSVVFFYFDIICDNYMYYDATPVDGNMYLFEKVN